MTMATISATERINKYFNKLMKSADYEDILAGTMGAQPCLFDEISINKNLVICTDILTDKDNKKRSLNICAIKKNGNVYESVISEAIVEIPSDMKAYVENAKKATLEVAAKVDGMGLVK